MAKLLMGMFGTLAHIAGATVIMNLFCLSLPGEVCRDGGKHPDDSRVVEDGVIPVDEVMGDGEGNNNLVLGIDQEAEVSESTCPEFVFDRRGKMFLLLVL